MYESITLAFELKEHTEIEYLQVTGDSNMDSGGDTEQWNHSVNCDVTSNDGWRGAKLFLSNSTSILEATQCGEDLDDG